MKANNPAAKKLLKEAAKAPVTELYAMFKQAGADLGPDSNIYQHIKDLPDYLAAAESEIAKHFRAILELMLIDTTDPNTRETSERLAKMYMRELFAGRYAPAPTITDFPKATPSALHNFLGIGPIEIQSVCSHHWAPIHGRCWIGVLPNERLLGLSKYARLVNWICRRPSLQENMVEAIADHIGSALNTGDVAVVIDAKHMCMSFRGVEEACAVTATQVMRGGFMEHDSLRHEFLHFISRSTNTI